MIERRKRVAVARLTTNVLNPFLVCLGLIVLLSFTSISSKSDAVKWVLVLLAFSVLPILIIVLYLLHTGKLGGIFIRNREERHKVYLLTSLCSIAGSVVLPRLGAPVVLMATYIAGLASVLIFMFINLRWKISVHTAFIAASATILIVLFGFAGAVSAALVPATAWARVELDHHSPAQAVMGAVLGSGIALVVFYCFGLFGHAA